MKLSLKATRFVIAALEHYQKYHDQRLQEGTLSEDEVSDLMNDRQYLEAIKEECEKHRDELMRRHEASRPPPESSAGVGIGTSAPLAQLPRPTVP